MKLRIRVNDTEPSRRAASDTARVALGKTIPVLERASLTLSRFTDAYRCRVLLVTHDGVRATSEVSHLDGLEAVRRAAARAARRVAFTSRQGATITATTPAKEQQGEAS